MTMFIMEDDRIAMRCFWCGEYRNSDHWGLTDEEMTEIADDDGDISAVCDSCADDPTWRIDDLNR